MIFAMAFTSNIHVSCIKFVGKINFKTYAKNSIYLVVLPNTYQQLLQWQEM